MSIRFEDSQTPFPASPERRTRPRSKPINIQDGFLFESLKENRSLVVALLNGEMVQGRIIRFDRYVVMVDDGKREVMFYKHMIACIARTSNPSDGRGTPG